MSTWGGAYKRTLLTRDLHPPKLTKAVVDLQYRSPREIYYQIMMQNRYELIPVYLKYIHKFPYSGVDRRSNYHWYFTQIGVILRYLAVE
jgi:hypothetical protein